MDFLKVIPPPHPALLKSVFYHKECIRKLSLTGLGRSVILLQGPAGLPAPAGQCPLWGSVASRQRETRGLGGLPPRGPQLGERRAENMAGEAGQAERKTIKAQVFSPPPPPQLPSPPQKSALRTWGKGGWGGGCKRFCILFLSYPAPTPSPKHFISTQNCAA